MVDSTSATRFTPAANTRTHAEAQVARYGTRVVSPALRTTSAIFIAARIEPPSDLRYTSIGAPLRRIENDDRKRASSPALIRPLMTIDRSLSVVNVAAVAGDAS